MKKWLLDILACPVNPQHPLTLLGDSTGAEIVDGVLRCQACDITFPIRRGLPILLLPSSTDSRQSFPLEGHKQQQVDYFDNDVASEFEIVRPHETPRTYQWLMAEKFRRSIAYLPPLVDALVLDVCCGSGMDAEFLAKQGARVIALDISEGCASRAQARAQRYCLEYQVVVGDVEHLPIRSSAVETAYVHDGLHHLDDPFLALLELARVATSAVSINEPADALATQIAVRVGLSKNTERAGNRVARLNPKEVAQRLEAMGFAVRWMRYFMYYRHEPGRLMRIASFRGFFRLYQQIMNISNMAIGRCGNKLQVTALRSQRG